MSVNGYPPERRAQPDGAYLLAILYTVGYLAMIAALFFVEMPSSNREAFLALVGIMSAAQLGIIKYYYDGTKAHDTTARAGIAEKARVSETLQEIAKAVPAALPIVAAAPPQPPDTDGIAKKGL